MLETHVAVPPEMAELVRWFVETVTPLAAENGWSVTVNGNAGTAVTDVRRTGRTQIEGGERRHETRDIRNFRLLTPPKTRCAEPTK